VRGSTKNQHAHGRTNWTRVRGSILPSYSFQIFLAIEIGMQTRTFAMLI
jgi:hypothetical protein